jgi:hypothetical protein
MGFEYINSQETYLVAILLVELVEGGNLPPEGRSGITSENQYHRSVGN